VGWRGVSLGTIAAALCLAGCGSSETSTTNSTAASAATQAAPSPTQTQTATQPQPAGSGDIRTTEAPATKLVTEYSFDPITYGTAAAPPSEVVNTCAGGNEPATEAFSQGTVSFKYVEGSVPLQFYVPSTNAAEAPKGPNSTFSIGVAAMQYQGQWHCEVENGKQNFTVQPGTTLTVPTWIMFGGARTNARTEFKPSELDEVSLSLAPEIASQTQERLEGPHVYTCESGPVLFPWSTAAGSGCHPAGEKATASPPSSTTATALTPMTGPLSKEPKVTPPSGTAPPKLVTREIVTGTGAEAKDGDTVTVNYVGVLYKTGKEFNASWETKEPFSFTLGQGQVIKGWDQGVVGMKVGGRRELIIPAEFAYGKTGSPPEIPANEALVFVVDLLGV
jgi:peptidylprolyl isomerase